MESPVVAGILASGCSKERKDSEGSKSPTPEFPDGTPAHQTGCLYRVLKLGSPLHQHPAGGRDQRQASLVLRRPEARGLSITTRVQRCTGALTHSRCELAGRHAARVIIYSIQLGSERNAPPALSRPSLHLSSLLPPVRSVRPPTASPSSCRRCLACAMEASSLAVVAAVLLLSSTLAAADFCVCRSDQPTTVLQKAIDFACGPQGGADCTAILQGGGCYNPNTVAAHCSWAANSYYQNNKARGATCDFGGAATVSTTDPSFSGCTFASSATSAGAGTGTAGTTTAGGATTGTGTGTFTPGVGSSSFNGTGMGGSTLGPTGNTLDAAAPGLLPGAASLAAATVLSFLALQLHH